MNANIKNNATVKETTSAIDSVSKATVMTMAGASGLVGLWATSCLVAAIVTNGPLGMISGFATAILG